MGKPRLFRRRSPGNWESRPRVASVGPEREYSVEQLQGGIGRGEGRAGEHHDEEEPAL
jgi:hypothetical protein